MRRFIEALKVAKDKYYKEGGNPIEYIDEQGFLVTKSYYFDDGDWYSDCVEIFDPETKDVLEIYNDGSVRYNGESRDIPELKDFLKEIYEAVFYG